MNDAIESTFDLFIVLALIIFDGFTILLSSIKIGVLKEQKELPTKKSTSSIAADVISWSEETAVRSSQQSVREMECTLEI